MAKKGAWDEEVFKTSFTSFWLKDIFLQSFLLVILNSFQDLKKGSSKKLSTKPDRTRPLWEENIGKIWIRKIFVILNSFQDPDGMPKQVRHDI